MVGNILVLKIIILRGQAQQPGKMIFLESVMMIPKMEQTHTGLITGEHLE